MDPDAIYRMFDKGVPDVADVGEFIEGRWDMDISHPGFTWDAIPRDEWWEVMPIIARQYGVPIHPARYFIDQDGNTVARGFWSEEAAAELGLYPGFDPRSATQEPHSPLPILPEDILLTNFDPDSFPRSLWRGWAPENMTDDYDE